MDGQLWQAVTWIVILLLFPVFVLHDGFNFRDAVHRIDLVSTNRVVPWACGELADSDASVADTSHGISLNLLYPKRIMHRHPPFELVVDLVAEFARNETFLADSERFSETDIGVWLYDEPIHSFVNEFNFSKREMSSTSLICRQAILDLPNVDDFVLEAAKQLQSEVYSSSSSVRDCFDALAFEYIRPICKDRCSDVHSEDIEHWLGKLDVIASVDRLDQALSQLKAIVDFLPLSATLPKQVIPLRHKDMISQPTHELLGKLLIQQVKLHKRAQYVSLCKSRFANERLRARSHKDPRLLPSPWALCFRESVGFDPAMLPGKPAGRPIHFIHIPKTGGTAVKGLLVRLARKASLTITEMYGDITAPPKRAVGLIVGHLPFGYLADSFPVTLVMLRDPVARFMSEYDYIRKYEQGKLGPCSRAFKQRSLSSNLQRYSEQLDRNRQSLLPGGSAALALRCMHYLNRSPIQYLCGVDCLWGIPGTEDEVPLQSHDEESEFQQAKRNLMQIDIVGVLEKTDQFVQQLKACFDFVPSSVELGVRNALRESDRSPLDQQVQRVLRAILAHETELYKTAAHLRRKECSKE